MEDQHQKHGDETTEESNVSSAQAFDGEHWVPFESHLKKRRRASGCAEHVGGTPQYVIITEHQPTDPHSPNFRFSWRLTSEGLVELQRREARFPYLVAVIVGTRDSSSSRMYRFFEERRLFSRLQDGEGLIQFERSGERTILFRVVFLHRKIESQSRADRDVRKLFSDWPKVSGGSDGCPELWHKNPACEEFFLPGTERVEIDIDGSLFAKRPPEWLWRWVNLWRKEQAGNSCDFKKSAIIAFTIQLLLVGLYILLRSAVVLAWFLILFLLGWRWRYLSLSTILHPFDGDLEYDVRKQSEWPDEWEGKARGFSCRRTPEGEEKSFALFWQMPLTFVALAFVGTFAYLAHVHAHFAKALVWTFTFCTGGSIIAFLLITIITIVGGIAELASFLSDRAERWALLSQSGKSDKPRKPAWERSADLLTTLVEDRPAVQAAPKPYPRPMLRRWLDAKGRLCLPYAR